MWLFPLYMLLINFFVMPIAMGGILAGIPRELADTYAIRLPLSYGHTLLPLLVFVGGFSSAAGMIMVSSMAVSIMVTNHLLLPVIEAAGALGFLSSSERERYPDCHPTCPP